MLQTKLTLISATNLTVRCCFFSVLLRHDVSVMCISALCQCTSAELLWVLPSCFSHVYSLMVWIRFFRWLFFPTRANFSSLFLSVQWQKQARVRCIVNQNYTQINKPIDAARKKACIWKCWCTRVYLFIVSFCRIWLVYIVSNLLAWKMVGNWCWSSERERCKSEWMRMNETEPANERSLFAFQLSNFSDALEHNR